MTNPESPLSEGETAEVLAHAKVLFDVIGSVVKGKADVIEIVITCLLAEGHLLLEDVPGVGKTTLARALAESLGLGWQRIQFTPDLLPSDILGVSVFHQDAGHFTFHKGPIFNNVILADEVNRGSPRTQSALLEAMEERQVSIDGKTYLLERPSIVIATQNPIGNVGTFPLPESQLDRFLMRVSMGYPSQDAEVDVLNKHVLGVPLQVESTHINIGHVIELTGRVYASAEIIEYVVRLVGATRNWKSVRLGCSPRASLGLLRAARVRAVLNGRSYVVPLDIQTLAEPVLAHRLVLDQVGHNASDLIREIVSAVQPPPIMR